MWDTILNAIEYVANLAVRLSSGMLTSVEIFVLTLVFSLPLGMIVAFGRMAKNSFIRGLTKFYIALMRGTPLMLQLFVIYFGPYYLFRIPLAAEYRFIAVSIAFSINYAAYFAEIYRSGIESMPLGQYEAAKVLGYNKSQTFFKIILPQVIKRVIPPVTNETITLVKDTSLAFAITCPEMFTLAKQVAAKEATVMPLMVACLFYFIFNFVVAKIMEFVEKKFSYYR